MTSPGKPFDYQPTLTGQHIQLRPLAENDFDALFQVARDPLIWRQHPERNRHEKGVFSRFFEQAMAAPGALVATQLSSRNIVGSSRYYGLNTDRGEIEIGWSFLARRCWGGVINQEMKRLMIEHAFNYVDTIVFFVGEGNIRSQKAVEKLGVEHVGERLSAGGAIDLRYELHKSRWETLMD